MECPVCQAKNLEPGTQVCPKCLTDLDMFHHISAVDQQLHDRKRNIRYLIGALIVVFLGWVITFVVLWGRQGATVISEPAPPVTVDTSTTELRAEHNALRDENTALTSEIEALKDSLRQLAEAARSKPKAPEANKTATPQPKQKKSPPPTGKGGGTHLVQSGETLWQIAQKHYGTGLKYLDIARHNNLEQPDLIAPGTELKIPVDNGE